MTTTTKVAVYFAAAAIATSAFADASNYTGPKMDLSSVQSEFRIGHLGDEAAQDIIDLLEARG